MWAFQSKTILSIAGISIPADGIYRKLQFRFINKSIFFQIYVYYKTCMHENYSFLHKIASMCLIGRIDPRKSAASRHGHG